MKAYKGVVSMLLLATTPCSAVISLTSSTAEFTAIGLGGPSDPVADSQAHRADLELVGNDSAGLYAFYLKFDGGGTADKTDGELAFRFRLSGDKGHEGIDDNAHVGLDLTGDGAIDFFIAQTAHRGERGERGQSQQILRAGEGANNSPATLSMGDKDPRNPGGLSHRIAFNGPVAVPEPAAVGWRLGLFCLVLTALRRRPVFQG